MEEGTDSKFEREAALLAATVAMVATIENPTVTTPSGRKRLHHNHTIT